MEGDEILHARALAYPLWGSKSKGRQTTIHPARYWAGAFKYGDRHCRVEFEVWASVGDHYPYIKRIYVLK
jgi:hypothetical protein